MEGLLYKQAMKHIGRTAQKRKPSGMGWSAFWVVLELGGFNTQCCSRFGMRGKGDYQGLGRVANDGRDLTTGTRHDT